MRGRSRKVSPEGALEKFEGSTDETDTRFNFKMGEPGPPTKASLNPRPPALAGVTFSLQCSITTLCWSHPLISRYAHFLIIVQPQRTVGTGLTPPYHSSSLSHSLSHSFDLSHSHILSLSLFHILSFSRSIPRASVPLTPFEPLTTSIVVRYT